MRCRSKCSLGLLIRYNFLSKLCKVYHFHNTITTIYTWYIYLKKTVLYFSNCKNNMAIYNALDLEHLTLFSFKFSDLENEVSKIMTVRILI